MEIYILNDFPNFFPNIPKVFSHFASIFCSGQVEDDILEMLMKLVFQLLCDGELMLAKILRDRVLSKIENNKQAQKMIHKQPISSLEVSVS